MRPSVTYLRVGLMTLSREGRHARSRRHRSRRPLKAGALSPLPRNTGRGSSFSRDFAASWGLRRSCGKHSLQAWVRFPVQNRSMDFDLLLKRKTLSSAAFAAAVVFSVVAGIKAAESRQG